MRGFGVISVVFCSTLNWCCLVKFKTELLYVFFLQEGSKISCGKSPCTGLETDSGQSSVRNYSQGSREAKKVFHIIVRKLT